MTTTYVVVGARVLVESTLVLTVEVLVTVCAVKVVVDVVVPPFTVVYSEVVMPQVTADLY